MVKGPPRHAETGQGEARGETGKWRGDWARRGVGRDSQTAVSEAGENSGDGGARSGNVSCCGSASVRALSGPVKSLAAAPHSLAASFLKCPLLPAARTQPSLLSFLLLLASLGFLEAESLAPSPVNPGPSLQLLPVTTLMTPLSSQDLTSAPGCISNYLATVPSRMFQRQFRCNVHEHSFHDLLNVF